MFYKLTMHHLTFLFFATFAECLPLEKDLGSTDLSHLGVSIFGMPDLESGRKLEGWNEQSGVNPEEIGEYVEGDILFPPGLSKNGLVAKTARWPDGEIPYEIAGYFNTKDKDTIKKAMEEYHRRTCIKFRRREPADPDWIAITNSNTGCWSSIGRTGGRQDVNLQSPGCLAKIGTPMHELLHAIGFQHEQNRWERDEYVTINWQNIQKGKENNFKKASKDSVTGFGVPYDYGSVMHYSPKAFSQNGETTIVVLQEAAIGQRDGFSAGDLEKIRHMYNCPAVNVSQSGGNNGSNNGDTDSHGGLLGGLISILFP